MNKTKEEILISRTKEMRKDILDMCYRCGVEKAHLGGCMSMVEILAVLYTEIMNISPKMEKWDERDRFILSKGHGGIALYAALKQAGILTKEEISRDMRGANTITYRHPKINRIKGIELSSGSLGMGLSFGAGLACAFLRKNYTSKVYVMLGDGECNEGSVWESAAMVSHFHLKNLTVIVDVNKLQLDGTTTEILNMESMPEKWKAFGFDVIDIDGHNISAIYEAFIKDTEKPKAIIANTIKGKGCSFAENNVAWHDNFLSDELYQLALSEL
jgi:transketolase